MTQKELTSRIGGFYKKTADQRLRIVQETVDIDAQAIKACERVAFLHDALDGVMIENHISGIVVPLGIATNFIIDGRELFIPMATEEPSVIAGACNAAKLARAGGGFVTSATESIMVGQMVLMGIDDGAAAYQKIAAAELELLAFVNSFDHCLVRVGGGARSMRLEERKTSRGVFFVLLLEVDVRDAMGANIVNTMLERLSVPIVRLVGGSVRMNILSNLTTLRTATATAVWKKSVVDESLQQAILDVHAFACVDRYRAATHNKGIMNGIDAVALATGNDFRALEAGAHAYAALSGDYQPLSTFTINQDGDLQGSLTMPLAVGIVGGSIKSNPMALFCLQVLKVSTAQELARVMVAVGLAQNFAALKALASEGISKGHMRLHCRNIAVSAGVPHHLVDSIADLMIAHDCISFDYAQELLAQQTFCAATLIEDKHL